MNGWSDFFLGTIAVATLVMAIIQVGAIVMIARVARDAQETLASVHKDIKPLIAKANAIADEASKTAALATVQVQKVDRLVTDLSHKIDETAALVQQAIVTPAREGMAIMAAIRAGLGALRGLADLRRASARAEEDDALFIG